MPDKDHCVYGRHQRASASGQRVFAFLPDCMMAYRQCVSNIFRFKKEGKKIWHQTSIYGSLVLGRKNDLLLL